MLHRELFDLAHFNLLYPSQPFKGMGANIWSEKWMKINSFSKRYIRYMAPDLYAMFYPPKEN